MKTYIDLHIHSTASDGTFSPTEIVNKALKLTEKDSPVVIALTDHDTVAGIDEFQKAAAKHKDRLTAISGLEISTDYHGVEIHVLGYNIDIHNKELLDRLAVCRESRDGRNEKIIQKLQEQGFKISMDEIKPDKPGETIARPHIAKLLMKKKYVSSVQEAFDKYLAEGRCCYVERIMPTPEEAIQPSSLTPTRPTVKFRIIPKPIFTASFAAERGLRFSWFPPATKLMKLQRRP